ncbi:phosphatidate cytidylyltransferase [Luteococcus japonicus]|uniref:Phosphatidate cytidylyltransferase n=1 Tax=Luteococcus japonicus TaxID=33984 RepID=A0A3N1ZXY4_9ACTN|nr:phosphatidate cytidylyltransferase [Luteococcus japonicus]ROR55711.1 phosphatidate cytidylyltransferase [Luteococcus japonicus]
MSQEKITPSNLTPPPKPSRAGRNLPAAIAVGVGLFGAVVATLAWWNWGFILLVALALGLGAVELHHAFARVGARTEIVPIVLGTATTVLGSYYAGQHPAHDMPSNTLIIGLLALTTLACLVMRLPRGAEGFVRDASASLFTLAYIPLLGSTVALMLADDDGRQRIITFLVCVIASDTGGYIAGVLFGKHPMAPRVSPKKTWEGFVGSLTAGMALGAVCTVWLLHAPWFVGSLLGLLLVAFGTAGDLVESMIKRDVGIKDMSSFLPGHGGVMDRLDSLLVAAPVAWFAMFVMVPAL